MQKFDQRGMQCALEINAGNAQKFRARLGR
jgi:hypothetical protein